eukprot:gnl/Chilomastix_cuspidata/2633.p1 GENE.gnl/Chilomastix_cuspidata/2633~~gnl/Chilomastix_cuspidata/2633.p1  ORF type:complete len:435 (-),score=76.48 gnl/Chilomastix_cuspidata/2633:37-1224(-)
MEEKSGVPPRTDTQAFEEPHGADQADDSPQEVGSSLKNPQMQVQSVSSSDDQSEESSKTDGNKPPAKEMAEPQPKETHIPLPRGFSLPSAPFSDTMTPEFDKFLRIPSRVKFSEQRSSNTSSAEKGDDPEAPTEASPSSCLAHLQTPPAERTPLSRPSGSPFHTFRPPTPPSSERFGANPNAQTAIPLRGAQPAPRGRSTLPFFARLWSFVNRSASARTAPAATQSPKSAASPRPILRDHATSVSERSVEVKFSEDSVEIAPRKAPVPVRARSLIPQRELDATLRLEFIMTCLAPACRDVAELAGPLSPPAVENMAAMALCCLNLTGPLPALLPHEWVAFAAFLLLIAAEFDMGIPLTVLRPIELEAFLKKLREIASLSPEELAALVNLCADFVE